MEVGDYARYVNTGTVGIVEDITESGGHRWLLLDVTDLYYEESTLEEASEDDYSEVSERERSLEDRLEDIRDIREKSKDIEESFSDISPGGT